MDVATVQIGFTVAEAVVEAIDTLIQARASAPDPSALVQITSKTLNLIEQFLPVIQSAFPALVTNIEQFVAILEGGSDLTDDQLSQLTTIRASLESERAAANAAAAAAGEVQS